MTALRGTTRWYPGGLPGPGAAAGCCEGLGPALPACVLPFLPSFSLPSHPLLLSVYLCVCVCPSLSFLAFKTFYDGTLQTYRKVEKLV